MPDSGKDKNIFYHMCLAITSAYGDWDQWAANFQGFDGNDVYALIGRVYRMIEGR